MGEFKSQWLRQVFIPTMVQVKGPLLRWTRAWGWGGGWSTACGWCEGGWLISHKHTQLVLTRMDFIGSIQHLIL